MGTVSHNGTSFGGSNEPLRGAPVATLLIGAFGLLFVAALSLYLAAAPTFTNDFWFHLKMGEVYWLEGLWPDTDPMLHTALPHAPIQHEWLFGVALHGLERATGFAGIRIVHGLVVMLTLWLAFSVARRSCRNTLVACLVATSFAILAWTRFFQVRPDLLSIPATLLTWRLLIDTHRIPSLRQLLAFALMILIWANAHSLFALAPLLLIAAVLGLGVRAVAEWVLADVAAGDRRVALALTRRVAISLGFAIGIALLVSLLNPRGFEQLLTFFSSSRDTAIWAVKDEWSHFDPITSANNPGTVSPLLWGLMDGVLIAFFFTSVMGIWATLRRRARALEIFDPVAFAVGLASIVAILVSVRFLWMAIFPMLFVGRALGQTLGRADLRRDSREIVSWALALATFALGVQFYRVGGYQTIVAKLPADVRDYLATPYLSRKFHVEGVRFLRDTEVEGRLFNSYGMGGFLGYWLSPRLSTFVDSRTEHYPIESINEHSRITQMREMGGRSTYLDVLERREVDFFFGVGMPVGLVNRGGGSTSAHLESIPGWVAVSRSLDHGIYLRDHPRNDENFEKIAQYYADRGVPFDRRRGFDVATAVEANLEWSRDHGLMTPVQAERVAKREGGSPKERAQALDALAWVYTLGGSYAAALEIEGELAQLGRTSKASLRRQILSAMKLDQPERAARAAAALRSMDPRDTGALVLQQLTTAFADVSRITAGRMEIAARNVALSRVAQRVPLLSPFDAALIKRSLPGEPRVDSP
ncbi:MAG: hypothetical protein JRG89_09975 [Deltaproteobacteria bacterium]|nr:hypothetical protein [Deltaproteobacteria bacterium]